MTRKELRYRLELGRLSIALGRSVVYTALGILLFVGIVLTATRVGVPYLVKNKTQIEKLVSERSGLSISIERMNVDWDRLFPGIEMHGLRVSTADGKLVTEAGRVSASITPVSLITGKVGLATVTVHGAQLDVRRDRNGKWWIGSLEFRTSPDKAVLPRDGKTDVGNVVARLGELNFINLRLVWVDEFLDQAPFVVKQAGLRVVSDGNHHVLSLSGKFPDKFCTACEVSVDISGRIDQPRTWTGRIYTEATGLNPARSPAIFRNRLPYTLSGVLNVALRAELYAGNPRVIQGYVSGEKLVVDKASPASKVMLNSIESSVLWRLAGDGWVFEARNMSMGVKRRSWNVGEVWLAKSSGKITATIDALDIADIGELVDSVSGDEGIAGYKFASFKPGGVLRNVELTVPLTGDDDKLHFSVAASFYELGWKGKGKIPTASGFDGVLHVDNKGGHIDIATTGAKLDIPMVFRNPLDIDQLSGSAKISKSDDNWELVFEDIDVSNQDLHLQGEALLQVPHSVKQEDRKSPYLKTRWKIVGGRGLRASRYFPVNKLKPNLLAWLDNSVKDGIVTGGFAVYEGHFNQFPFRNNNGHFEVMANIEKGVLQFLPRWPALRNIDARLHFIGTSMNITSHSATLNGMSLRQVSVSAENFSDAKGRRLQINGKVSGSGQSLMGVINQVRNASYVNTWARAIPKGISASGRNSIRLSLDYDPATPGDTVVLGDYRPDNMRFNMATPALKARGISGKVNFDSKGVSSGNIYGELLGASARFSITSNEEDGNRTTRVTATGGVTADGIAENYGRWIGNFLRGNGQWYGEYVAGADKPSFKLEADLDDLVSGLPEPMHKTEAMPARLVVTSLPSAGDNYALRARIPNMATMELHLRKQGDSWRHHRSVILFGKYESVAIPGPGLHVIVDASRLDLDAWRQHLQESEIQASVTGKYFSSLQLNTGQLELFDRQFGGVAAHVSPVKGKWKIRLTGDGVDGTIFYDRFGQNGRVEAELERLVIPGYTFREQKNRLDVRKLPIVKLHVRDLAYGDMRLGVLNLRAKNISTGWSIEHARFDSDDLHITSWGVLKRMGGRNHGELELTGSSNNLGKGLERLALPGQVSSGTAHASASLDWNGVDEFSISSANGKFKIKAENGSFLKLDQGAGKMLGIFDFDAFSRYARLDFSTLFGTGYAFDVVKGTLDLERGHIYTRDLKINGPSADMFISGRVGLVDEDYDFVVGVNPSVSDTLAFASWGLGVPQVGAAILLFNRFFKKDIEQAGRLTYLVQGTWEKPVVRRIEKSK